MSQRRAVPSLAGLLMLVALGLTSCSNDSATPKPLEPKSSTSLDSRPTPTMSASAAPTLPPEARGSNKTSAEAFARYYVTLINYAMHSGNASPMRQAALQTCVTCHAVASSIVDVYSKSGHVEGDGWRIRSVTSVTRLRRNTEVRLRIQVTREVVYDTATAKPSTSDALSGSLVFQLKGWPNAGAWAVAEMDALA